MIQRTDVLFLSGEVHCAAWLYQPERQEPHPVIIMAHGLGGTREMRLDAYAEKFCRAGYACLVFDYRHFGASEGQPRQLLDIAHQLQDWRSAVAYARTLDSLDATRVILWGSSFSGGHVLEVAAADSAIAAAMVQGPFTDGPAACRAMDTLSLLKVGALALADMVGSMFGAAPVMVKLVGPRHSAALLTAADAEPGYLALKPEHCSFQNQVAARIALSVLRYSPGRQTAKIQCPTLFCICRTDSVAPAGPALRYAGQAPDGEVHLCQEGHFAIYLDEAFEQVSARQLDFLKRKVPFP
ncbi:alpha/beta hydrolase [Pseudomonas sp. LjRoot71]|uniref:alpha/beta hydrolase n=1 Tax=Pseudomonas TaxID=286 RepID=UPI00193CD342|nr:MULTISPECIES: alpha/beta hydrolase [Pseudomonas]MBM3109985.1 alpha/beta hydrolase [Pseudomonas arcuscaelestis]